MSDDLPRRIYLDRMTPAELAIRDAMLAVECVGADPLLTDAVVLLGQAQRKVADYVDRGEPEFSFAALSQEKDGGLAAEAVETLRRPINGIEQAEMDIEVARLGDARRKIAQDKAALRARAAS